MIGVRLLATLVPVVWTGAAAEITYREKIAELSGPWRAAEAGWEFRFVAPPFDHTRHIRLRLSGLDAGARVTLNDHLLDANKDSPTHFDASDFLTAGRSNVLQVTNSPAPRRAEWIETPRVFIVNHLAESNAGNVRVSAWVRNTLENTSIVTMTVSLDPGGSQLPAADATIGPGVTQEIVVTGVARGRPERAQVLLTKEAEAMEGGYRYETWTTIATKPQ
jgi:hypothetical protein